MKTIDADALIAAIHDEWDEACVWDASGEETADEFERLVDAQPTIEERKNGRDICDTVKDHHCEFKCSICGEEIIEHWGGTFSYCPYCGADMRG